jgi:hypothetical protein
MDSSNNMADMFVLALYTYLLRKIVTNLCLHRADPLQVNNKVAILLKEVHPKVKVTLLKVVPAVLKAVHLPQAHQSVM